MTETPNSRTKTTSELSEEDNAYNPLITDRWTNNISYRQLVISSCIGIMQLWYHPYVHDLTKLIPFLFLYNVFSVIIGYPHFYLELALGVITKKGVLNCWDLSPMSRGIGFGMLITCAFTALAVGTVAAWCLALFVHSFHSFLPWLHCASAVEVACTARHRPMSNATETPAMSFFNNFVLNLKRDGLASGLGAITPELSVYYVISWFLIYFIVIKRIYSYSKIVLFKDVLSYFVLVCCAIGAARLDGAARMFQVANWRALYNDLQIWREAIEYALIQMTVSQGSLVMLGAYCPKQRHTLGRTSLYAFSVSKTSSMAAAMILGAVNGALTQDYQNDSLMPNGTATSLVLWADFVSRVGGGHFWSALVFFTLFVVALSSAALLVQTMMSTLTGRTIRKMSCAFLVIICTLFCLIGVLVLCTQGALYVQNFLMKFPAQKPRVPIAAIAALIVTFSYGQTTFCEDVYFAVGEYPCVFIRVCWAVTPALLMGAFIVGLSDVPAELGAVGWALVALSNAPIVLIMLLYFIFRVRIRNIVTEK